MNESEENKYLAILYNNLQGKRVDDWIEIAQVCKKLSDFYGSHQKLAEKVGRTREDIRSTIKLLDLPKEVQKMVKDDKLHKDVAWRIVSVPKTENQIKIAKAVEGMNVHDARELVYYFTRDQTISLDDYKNKIKHAKNKVENLALLVIPIDKEKFAKFNHIAKNKSKTPQKLVLELVDKMISGG